jgi:hypothetical protein
MVKQIIAVLCEGPHDVAFITKILRANGFKSNESEKIGKYPIPMNDMLKSEVLKLKVEDLNAAKDEDAQKVELNEIGQLNLQETRLALLPLNALVRNEDSVFLYSLGGDSKILKKSQPLLKKFDSFIPKEEGGYDEALPIDTHLAILYFLDSDKKGIDARVAELNKEIYDTLGMYPFKKHNTAVVVNKIKLGAFIFTGIDNNYGKLEDILVPLMQQGNEKIFEDAQKYLDDNFHKSRVKKNNYDESKSKVGIVGQLQKSGGSNVVCIGQTDYLTLEKIQSNAKCQEIIAFFETFLAKNTAE